jgi:hypothetical protein
MNAYLKEFGQAMVFGLVVTSPFMLMWVVLRVLGY